MPQGLLFVLFTGISRDDLPQELGIGSDMTGNYDCVDRIVLNAYCSYGHT